MFFNFPQIGTSGLLLCGAFIFIGIYGYTTLMDRSKYAIWIEVVRGFLGLLLIGTTGDWFGLNSYVFFGSYLIATYFLITIIAAFYFTYSNRETTAIAKAF